MHYINSHLMITFDGLPLLSWQKVFPHSNTIIFGEVVQTDAEMVWLKLNGLASTQLQVDWVRTYYSHLKLVVLTSIPLASEALLALSAGARAYVNAHAGPQSLSQIADIVSEGGIWVGEDMMQFLVASLNNIKTEQDYKQHNVWREKVSNREAQVVDAAALGASNKVIARQLGISERTVKAHLSAVFEKLDVNDRLKLALLVNGKF
jgi:two-component system, NarL family, nitrate/nitrite response regulator NarL